MVSIFFFPFRSLSLCLSLFLSRIFWSLLIVPHDENNKQQIPNPIFFSLTLHTLFDPWLSVLVRLIHAQCVYSCVSYLYVRCCYAAIVSCVFRLFVFRFSLKCYTSTSNMYNVHVFRFDEISLLCHCGLLQLFKNQLNSGMWVWLMFDCIPEAWYLRRLC